VHAASQANIRRQDSSADGRKELAAPARQWFVRDLSVHLKQVWKCQLLAGFQVQSSKHLSYTGRYLWAAACVEIESKATTTLQKELCHAEAAAVQE